jgi:hypothetical protein
MEVEAAAKGHPLGWLRIFGGVDDTPFATPIRSDVLASVPMEFEQPRRSARSVDWSRISWSFSSEANQPRRCSVYIAIPVAEVRVPPHVITVIAVAGVLVVLKCPSKR